MRQTVGVLRDTRERAPLGPQRGVIDLERLVQEVERSGLPVTLTVTGGVRPLPATLDLAVYRIVQEGLTNVRKHAGPAQARVTINYEPDSVEVVIADDGHLTPPPSDGGGHGLVGVRERVTLLGGELEAAPAADGGFVAAGAAPARVATTMIRVLLADDQALVRQGFRLILELEADLEVVAEAADGREAVRLTRELAPDVVVMDIRMPELDGIEATRRLQAAGATTRVLILTTFDLDQYLYEAMRAGASGFLLKDAPSEQLVAGIRTVAAGDALLAPALTRRLIEHFVRRPPPDTAPPPEPQPAHQPRTRGADTARPRPLEHRNRRNTVPGRGNDQNPRRTHPAKTRPPRPRTSRRLRLRNRPHPTRPNHLESQEGQALRLGERPLAQGRVDAKSQPHNAAVLS